MMCPMHDQEDTVCSSHDREAGRIVESRRDIPYGPRNLQKFAHFYVLSAHYIALSEKSIGCMTERLPPAQTCPRGGASE
jgi:hypothetical protein